MAPHALQRELNTPEWKVTTRVAFRFFVVYLTLYAAATQILGGLLVFPGLSFPALGTRWPMRDITTWWAGVLRVESPLVTTGNSGDTAFYWVQTGWLLVLAVVIAGIWSELDRRREYPALHRWFRLFVRFALAAQMFYYGMAKVIPTQFPSPSLVTLLEPTGNLTLSDMLWTFIGASTAYQVFAGIAEVAAGVLLVIPQTASLGALIALADMIQVLALNVSYDFGLKQISLHLILMSLFLLAPDMPRIWRVLVSNRDTAARAPLDPFADSPRPRVAVAAQLAFGVYLLAVFTNLSWTNWSAISGGRPRSPLYGVWDVNQLSIDGASGPPSQYLYDYRWRRVIFDTPDVVVIQRTDDSFLHYASAVDAAGRRVTLSKGNSNRWRGNWSVERMGGDRLVLRGEMEGYQVEARLHRVGLDTFRLLNSSFRWVRPPDPTLTGP